MGKLTAISFNKGIHRSPGLGELGQLAECVNLMPLNGELRNIVPGGGGEDQRWLPQMASVGDTEQLLYAHSLADGQMKYIYLLVASGVSYIRWTDGRQNSSGANWNIYTMVSGEVVYDVKSIGNTLLISTNKGMRYVVWKQGSITGTSNHDKSGSYKDMGCNIPFLNMQFQLDGRNGWAEHSEGGWELAGNSDVQYKDNAFYFTSVSYNDLETGIGVYRVVNVDLVDKSMKAGSSYKITLDAWYDTVVGYMDYSTDGNTWLNNHTLGYGKEFSGVLEGTDGTTYRYIRFRLTSTINGMGNNLPEGKDGVAITVLEGTQQVGDTKYRLRDYDNNVNSETLINKIMGTVNAFLEDNGYQDKKFVYPFLVRYALKMYDGSYISPSSPILMVPCSGPTPSFWVYPTSGETYISVLLTGMFCDLTMKVSSSDLTALANWKDFIKGVSIGISEPIYTYNQGYVYDKNVDNIPIVSTTSQTDDGGKHYVKRGAPVSAQDAISQFDNYMARRSGAGSTQWKLKLPTFSTNDIAKKVSEISQFYIIKDYTLDELASFTSAFTKIELDNNTLAGLQGRPVLSDNALSLNQRIPQYMFNYNHRLNIANYKEKKFEGYDPAQMCGLYYKNGAAYGMQAEVEVTDENGSYKVMSQINKSAGSVLWFFYPNRNAKKATIYYRVDNSPSGWLYYKKEVVLNEHPLMNGAYWFGNFSEIGFDVQTVTYPAAEYHSETPLLDSRFNELVKLSNIPAGITSLKVSVYYKIEPEFPLPIPGRPQPMPIWTESCTTKTIAVSNGACQFYLNAVITGVDSSPVRNYALTKMTADGSTEAGTSVISQDTPVELPVVTGVIVDYQNKIARTRVDNPFNFEGVDMVNSDKIVGLSAVGMALNRDQYGKSPLIVFTNDGIWGIGIDSTGKYETHQVSNRDVIVNGEILQTDGAVFYVTQQGLKKITEGGNTLVCKQMEGMTFDVTRYNGIPSAADIGYAFADIKVQHDTPIKTFGMLLKTAKFAYDYPKRCIHIYPDSVNASSNYFNYMYLIDTDEIVVEVNGSKPTAIVNGFPDTIIQGYVSTDAPSGLGTFEKQRRYNSKYPGYAFTRPIAFDNPAVLKMLRGAEVLSVLRLQGDSKARVAVWGSDNQITWTRVTSMRQQSWKYYTFGLFTNMEDDDSVQALMCDTEERYGRRLR